MSVYGCPEQKLNHWIQTSITIRGIDNLKLLDNKEKLFTLGPFEKGGFQLHFCTKIHESNSATKSSINTEKSAEWPRGDYMVFSHSGNCPKGEKITQKKNKNVAKDY